MDPSVLKALDLSLTLLAIAAAAQRNAQEIVAMCNGAAAEGRALTDDELRHAQSLADAGTVKLDAAIARQESEGSNAATSPHLPDVPQ